MRTGLLILDGTGAIALFDRAAEQILGYSAREVLGKPAASILGAPVDVSAACGTNGPEISTKNARHKDGRSVPVIVTPYAIPAGGGRLSGAAGLNSARPADSASPPTGNGAVLLLQDARQLQKMQDQLQHLDRLNALDEFAAGIVHEIRNPLAGISINAQYIVEEIETYCRGSCAEAGRRDQFHAQLHEEMRDILADVQSIEDIVARVLDFAHPNRPQVREVPVPDIIEEVLRLSKPLLRRQGIRLRTAFGTSARVRADVPQMKQVLFNIVRNACDAMPGGGRLSVTTGRVSAGGPEGISPKSALSGASGLNDARPAESYDRLRRTPGSVDSVSRKAEPILTAAKRSRSYNGTVRVAVADTGRGIAEANLERIFDPFFSMHREGTGLGLAISRRIVENHGGRIEVRSSPGKGAEFAIYLPAV